MKTEDIETAFKTVDMDKSGEISKRVIFFSQPGSYFDIFDDPVFIFSSGAEAGREIPEQEIWIERCKRYGCKM